MFFWQKLAELVVMPAASAWLLVVAGLVVSFRRPPAGRVLVGLGLAVGWGLGSTGVATRLVAPLERAYPRPPDTLRAEAAVVLCGTLDLSRSTPGRLEFGDAPERIVEGARLVKEGRARWLVITGGSGDPLFPQAREASLLARFAVDCGVAPSAVLTEGDSRTTAENAAFTAKLLREKGIRTLFLVTSAFHLPRSMGCFRKAGLRPIAYPVDFRATPPQPSLLPYVPTAAGLQLSTTALHEYCGFVAYWLGGRL